LKLCYIYDPKSQCVQSVGLAVCSNNFLTNWLPFLALFSSCLNSYVQQHKHGDRMHSSGDNIISVIQYRVLYKILSLLSFVNCLTTPYQLNKLCNFEWRWMTTADD